MTFRSPEDGRTRRARLLLAAVAALVALPGCQTTERHLSSYRANVPDLAVEDVAAFRSSQEALIREFVALADAGPLDVGDDWSPVAEAGMHYADIRCDRFLEALRWFGQVRRATHNQVRHVGAAASAALALAEAARGLLALAPIGVELADRTLDNLGEGLLFSLDAGTVRGLVRLQQQAFRERLADTVPRSRVAAMRLIQGYSQTCLPGTIEAAAAEMLIEGAAQVRPPETSAHPSTSRP